MFTQALELPTVPDFMPTRIHQGGADVAPCGAGVSHGVGVLECDESELCSGCRAHGRLTSWVRA